MNEFGEKVCRNDCWCIFMRRVAPHQKYSMLTLCFCICFLLWTLISPWFCCIFSRHLRSIIFPQLLCFESKIIASLSSFNLSNSSLLITENIVKLTASLLFYLRYCFQTKVRFMRRIRSAYTSAMQWKTTKGSFRRKPKNALLSLFGHTMKATFTSIENDCCITIGKKNTCWLWTSEIWLILTRS